MAVVALDCENGGDILFRATASDGWHSSVVFATGGSDVDGR